MVECRFCDHRNPAGATRCTKCGAELPESAPATPTPGWSAADDLTELERRVLTTFQAEGKIAAIKVYREAAGGGLKEAKDAVEALAARQGLQPAGTKTGCAGMALLAITAAGILIIALGFVN